MPEQAEPEDPYGRLRPYEGPLLTVDPAEDANYLAGLDEG